MRVYLAAPLFTLAERLFNNSLARMIQTFVPEAEIYVPQDSVSIAIKDIWDDNVRVLSETEWVIAICDGPDMDSGTAWEVGFASAAGKKIIGVRTDFRAVGDDCDIHFANLMISMSVHHRVHLNSQTHSVSQVAEEIAHYLRHG